MAQKALRTLVRRSLSTRWMHALHLPAITGLAVLGLAATASAQDPAPTYTWSGTGGNNLYSNGNNWVGGSTPGYGNLNFGNSTTNTTVDVDTTNLAQHAIYFISSSNYTLTDQGFTFYDYSGYPSKIENDGTGTGTVNVPLTFASGTSGSTGLNRAEINAISGDLVFGSAGTITMTGGAVNGLQLFGTGHTVTFNGVISDNGGGKYVEINQGNTAVFNAANTYSGNTDVYDGSTLQFAANGSAANSVIRLGNDDASGVTAGSATNTVSLINATGGQNVGSVFVVAAGTGLLSSTNTSGTNTYSGGIYLDSNLTIAATAAGGTFALTGTVDVKSSALTISGAGVVNASSGIQSSGGGGAVTYAGTGTLLLNGTGNNTGTTTINSGTLGGTGSVAGAVNVNAAILNPGPIGTAGNAAAVGTLTTGALTLASTATSTFDIASATNFDKLASTGAVAYAGTLTINLGTYAPTGTTTYQLFTDGSESGAFTDDASVAFNQAGYAGTFNPVNGTLTITAVPEPATYLGGLLMAGAAGYGLRRRRVAPRVV